MIRDEDHGFVAVVLAMLLCGSIDGEAMVNGMLAIASTRSRGVVVVGASCFLLRNAWPVLGYDPRYPQCRTWANLPAEAQPTRSIRMRHDTGRRALQDYVKLP
jgi:hypothetical protein